MTGNDVRRKYLEYFEKHNHRIVRSSSLVPQDDPTLLFTNAGMVQFKRCFLGEDKRDYVRATTSQKCVRAGGKHNDLENVGYTARHHTFFEMLGNFSFGDYFKEKAIEFAWDLMVNGYGLPADKLWASVFLDDDEAFELWHKITGIPEDRIVRFGEEDNFWAMGDTGPCGPCSEILLDRGEQYGCDRPDCKVGCECDRYLELWNLVFMQFDRDASGKMTPLPKPSIDTGLGLERVVTVLQNVDTNYDTDLMMPIINKAEDLAEKQLGQSFETDVALKVIADHSRATAFLIGDGVLPSNEGRGYVLRRIMRRAIRYGRNIGLNKPFLHNTAGVVFDIMQPAYPELAEDKAYITNVIHNEEQRFSETLDFGLKLLNDTLDDLQAQGTSEVPGDVIFKLYDTYGFPVDIVRDVVRDQKMTLDMAGFDDSMAKQKAQSHSVATFDEISDAYKKFAATGIKPVFVGYEQESFSSKILVLVQEGDAKEEAGGDGLVEVVTEATPFYGEAGGQVGDVGVIEGATGRMDVEQTLKDPTGLIIHIGRMANGSIKNGESVTLNVDRSKRRATELNHTATHILQSALRKVLGDHVKQAGSSVGPERLRFDFTHFSQVDAKEIEQIETLVNERIRANVAVDIKEMAADEAFKTGATALFEEKYGVRVRVISLSDFSKELCGGTHTDRTGNIGLLKIIAESSVASGVRRIEAVTGAAAVSYMQQTTSILRNSAKLLKEKPETLSERIEKMLQQQKAGEKEIEKLKSQIATLAAGGTTDVIQEINGVKTVVKRVEVQSPAELRDMADKFKDRLKSGIVVLGSTAGAKVFLTVGVTKDLVKKYQAGEIIKPIATLVGGSGGGRPDLAQAGGTLTDKLDQALEEAYKVIEQV